ncbi:MAG: CPBP family intramembrane metalloprotease [Candidatus Sumerlaeia bacterium]|nr:CPBP family intramembrane metalloprotease [Candidatus Sumerlaeia bacterium]
MVRSRQIIVPLVPAMVVPATGALFYFVWFPGTAAGHGFYAATKVFTLVWPTVAYLFFEGNPLSLKGLDVAKHIRAAPAGMGYGLLIAAAMLLLYAATPMGDEVRAHADAIRGRIAGWGLGTPARFIAFGVFLAFAHSLLEEYYWRWYVFGRLERIVPPAAAYGLAGLAFAAHHYIVLACYFPLGITVLFGTIVGGAGVFWCWLYRTQQSLVGAWLSHAWADAAILYVGYELTFG